MQFRARSTSPIVLLLSAFVFTSACCSDRSGESGARSGVEGSGEREGGAGSERPTTTATEANASDPTMKNAPNEPTASDKVVKSEEEWRRELTPEQFRIMREKGTERAFTGKYWNTHTEGTYRCAACGMALFTSDSKFDSGCGWPSFSSAFDEKRIDEHTDSSLGMVRTEVTCSRCGAHLGHVFEDGPAPTGLRYCINSASIVLDEKAVTKEAAPAKKNDDAPKK